VYKFIDTGETIEVQQSFNDATLTEAVHPESGNTLPVKKVFLPVGVTFKGDGFYKTDNRSKKKSAATPAGASDTGGSGKSSESGSSSGSESGSSSGGSSGSSSGGSSDSSGGSSGSSGSSTAGKPSATPKSSSSD
jgi:predicted nucleic acid-binding Zn ribbon protein